MGRAGGRMGSKETKPPQPPPAQPEQITIACAIQSTRAQGTQTRVSTKHNSRARAFAVYLYAYARTHDRMAQTHTHMFCNCAKSTDRTSERILVYVCDVTNASAQIYRASANATRKSLSVGAFTHTVRVNGVCNYIVCRTLSECAACRKCSDLIAHPETRAAMLECAKWFGWVESGWGAEGR